MGRQMLSLDAYARFTALYVARESSMPKYYVVSIGDEHKGWMDNCIVWWRANGEGYTYDLNDAGVYTDEDRARGYPSEKSCRYIPKEIVDAHCRSPRLAWWSDGWKDPICAALGAGEAWEA
jgi:hypothetical protein